LSIAIALLTAVLNVLIGDAVPCVPMDGISSKELQYDTRRPARALIEKRAICRLLRVSDGT
jgi:hypothetical protein